MQTRRIFRSGSSAVACLLLTMSVAAFAQTNLPATRTIAAGPFQPTWASLAAQYQCPEWFRDAKFGIWAVYGPQCQAEDGDWYARGLYLQGSAQNKFHVAQYGPPSQFGFKDVIHEWKAENFHPDDLLAFYKKSGAKYFMAMANHHDNFDMYDSKYQPWNSVAIGPKQDIIGMFAKAAKKNGLRFAVSVHATHTWTWYEPAQGADKTGPLAGAPYDGKLTKADGKGLWWDGLDPQDLYAQNHPPGNQKGWDWWNWDPAKGATIPDAAYMQKFFLRTQQLWDDYRPDMVYFDDTVLPFHGITDDLGLELAAHFYNSSIKLHGRNEAVMNGKFLDPLQRQALVYDIERGKATGILPEPWQTDTCLGDWHYQRAIFEKHQYKTAATVIPMLADVVSKNGNLMLSVPVRGDGSIDSDEHKNCRRHRRLAQGQWPGDLRHAAVENFRRRTFHKKLCQGPVRRPARHRHEAVHAGGHPFHPVEGRQNPLRHRAGVSAGRQGHHSIAGGKFRAMVGQGCQRPAAGRARQIKIHPRPDRTPSHLAGHGAKPDCLCLADRHHAGMTRTPAFSHFLQKSNL